MHIEHSIRRYTLLDDHKVKMDRTTVLHKVVILRKVLFLSDFPTINEGSISIMHFHILTMAVSAAAEEHLKFFCFSWSLYGTR